MRTRFLAPVLVLVLVPAGCTETDTPQARPVSYRLDNGLRVMLRPAESAPLTGVVVLFSLGGDQDPAGKSGLAHLVEHVYVTAGTGEQPARVTAELTDRYAQGWNAQTGDDYTVIGAVVPPEDLDRELQDAAARMGDLHVTEADVERERPRLLDEVANMFGGIPTLAASNLARELIHPTAAGGRKGGLPAHVQTISVSEVHERWRSYYKPANATLVVTGHFRVDDVMARVQRSFGRLPPGQPAPRASPPGTPRPGSTTVVSVTPTAGSPTSTVSLAFAAPSPADTAYPAFLVIAARLMQENPAAPGTETAGPMVNYAVLDDPAVLFVSAPLGPGESPQDAVGRLDAMLATALRRPLGRDDLTLARAMFGPLLGLNDYPAESLAQNPYGVGFSLARRGNLGIDPATLDNALGSVTDKDLERVRELLAPDRRAAGVVTVGG